MNRVHDLQTPIRVLVPQPLEYKFHICCTKPDLSHEYQHGTTTHTVCLLREPEPDERVQRKARIPYPARTIIPVTCSTDVFGEGKSGAGNDGPGRLVDKQFEREGRAVDSFFPRSGVGRLRDPVVPVPAGDLYVRERKKCAGRGLDTHG